MLRAGRVTPAQARALQVLWPQLGVDLPPGGRPLEVQALFGRAAPCVLEIGFGNGEALCAMASAAPETSFLGAEVYAPGVGHLLGELDRRALTNVRVTRADAGAVLAALPAASLTEVYVLFPDPWPKKRHHKRRLVDAEFLALVAQRLAPGGLLRMATDWADYAQQMDAVLAAEPALERISAPPRPLTKYERRGLRLGHVVVEFAARRR